MAYVTSWEVSVGLSAGKSSLPVGLVGTGLALRQDIWASFSRALI